MKYRIKTEIFEATTFDELVEYGRTHSGNIVNGMPWSFQFQGLPVTHENDDCYLISDKEGTKKFTREDILVINTYMEIVIMKLKIFSYYYEVAENTPC